MHQVRDVDNDIYLALCTFISFLILSSLEKQHEPMTPNIYNPCS